MSQEPADAARVTFSLERAPGLEEGYPVRRSEAVTMYVAPEDVVSAENMKIAARDAELMAGIFRDHADDLRSFYNDVVAGRGESASATAQKIGLNETSFKKEGGGMWPFILGAGVIILGCVAFDCGGEHHHHGPHD